MNSTNVSAQESQELMDSLRPHLTRLQMPALIAGIIGLLGCAIGAVTNPTQFFQSYIYGYFFWFGLTVGSLGILMLHHVVGGGCFFLIRRPLEAATRVLPFMFALFVPVFFGMPAIYLWCQPEYLKTRPIVAEKVPLYLNTPAFIGRTVFFFAVWIIFAFFLNKLSRRQDRDDLDTEEIRLTSHKLNMLGAGGLVAFAFTVTFAAFDWLMSMDPEWYSTLFGAYIAIGMFLSTLAGMTILINLIAGKTGILERVPTKYYRDLGNFTLAFCLLWAYMSFSQWVIIWTANLGDEVVWFLARMRNGWQYVAGCLIFIHFGLPFFTLLVGSPIKKKASLLARVACLIVVMRFVDLYWIIEPTYRHAPTPHLLDLAAIVGVGGIWLFFFFGELKKVKYLLPLNDPRFTSELAGSSNAHGADSHGHHGHIAAPAATGMEVAAHG